MDLGADRDSLEGVLFDFVDEQLADGDQSRGVHCRTRHWVQATRSNRQPPEGGMCVPLASRVTMCSQAYSPESAEMIDRIDIG